MLKRLLLTPIIGLCAAAAAFAAPALPKYHFELAAVTAKPSVAADMATLAQDKVEQHVKKAFAAHPRLLTDVAGAPDPETAPDAYRKFLIKKAISGSYRVAVEVTEASHELVPQEGKANAQRFVVRLGIHVLGETIPGQTMGFTGEGQATVKLEVGAKLRDRDRDYAWDSAAQTAVDEALKTCFLKLGQANTKKR